MPISKKEYIDQLIKMADKLDQEGKSALAAEIDKTIKDMIPKSVPMGMPPVQSIKISSDELDMLTEKGKSERVAKILASLGRAFEVTKHPDGTMTVGLNNTILLSGGKGLYPKMDKRFKSIKTAALDPSKLTPEMRIMRGQLKMAIRDNDGFRVQETLSKPEFTHNLESQIGTQLVAALQILVENGDFKSALDILGIGDKEFKPVASDSEASLISEAARPKAPLKHLDDGTKKNLLLFLHKADNEIKESITLLQEFFKRLRYFDIDNTVEHLDLDRIMIDMSKNEERLNIATKKFYEMTAGRRPGKDGIESFVGAIPQGSPIQSAEDFFDSQSKKDTKSEAETEKENLCRYCKGKGHSGPHGDACGHCDGSGLEIEMPPSTKYEDYDAKDSGPKEELEHCEQCAEDCAGDCYCHDKLDEKDLANFWKEESDEANDANSVGRMSPNGIAITNVTGGEWKEE
ncbi:MAG: hypothetical protein WC523_00745 [Patescibacteria group bacterium]